MTTDAGTSFPRGTKGYDPAQTSVADGLKCTPCKEKYGAMADTCNTIAATTCLFPAVLNADKSACVCTGNDYADAGEFLLRSGKLRILTQIRTIRWNL